MVRKRIVVFLNIKYFFLLMRTVVVKGWNVSSSFCVHGVNSMALDGFYVTGKYKQMTGELDV